MREKYELLLLTLAEKPDGLWIDDKGSLTPQLVQALPFSTSTASLNPMLNRLVDCGWIEMDRRGRRTYRVELIADPLSPPEPTPEPAPEVLPSLDDDDLELQGRPGRFAARLERKMPELVDQAVKRALASSVIEVLRLLSDQLGFDPDDGQRLKEAEVELAELRERNEKLTTAIGNERALREYLQDELTSTVARSPEGRIASTKSLMMYELPELYRDLGKIAIENGWTILKSRGGHLVWKPPNGDQLYYSGSTPSDWRAVRNDRAALERMGLPKVR